MDELVQFNAENNIAIIAINNPPVNALSPGVPEGIADCIEKANQMAGVDAIVLIGGGRSFVAGADIKNMDKGAAGTAPMLTKRLSDIVEASNKPVVAAIHGFALGGGLELALGCHYRIAVETAKVGLPEVLIGILPGGAGTQRLPRLIGPRNALEMIVSGRHVPALEALSLGVLDQVIGADEDLLDAAIAFATEQIGNPIPRVSQMTDRLRELEESPGLFDEKRKQIARKARNQKAPYYCIDSVEAATRLPFADGVKKERELFTELVQANEAKALRYAFFAERECARIPDVPADTPTRSLNPAVVIGGGTMGTGIAMCLANAGIRTSLLELNAEALAAAMARIAATYDVSVKRGSMSLSDKNKALGLIKPITDYQQAGDAAIAIEAVFEDMQVKQEVFRKLEKNLPADAILATNSSALDIDEIAAAVSRPENVIGTHFFSPANVMALLEIVKARKTDKSVIASVMKLAKIIDKKGVVCGNCDGFVANRSRLPFTTEVNVLIEQGATPFQIDRVMYEFGYPMGPLAVADLAGGDIGYAGRKRREKTDPNARQLPIADCLVEMGRLGQKTSAGWYLYKEGDRTPHPDPAVDEVIAKVQQDLGITPRQFSDEEILMRILFASVNEACKILEEKIAYRASDIDVMWLGGFGFPRYRGGLMFWADSYGTAAVHARIAGWYAEFGGHWKPSGLLEQLARENRSFREI
jgi:3-hydroxyacyl-CoA dehydrogenase